MDGIAALLILLTTLLSFISVYSSFSAITKREKEYYAFLLLLETGMVGVFCALDFFLFYVFWEVMLVPMYFLIGIWGGPRKLYAAIKFFLYTLAGSVVMLLAIIALYFFNTSGFLWWKGLGNAPTFDIVHFQTIASSIPRDLQLWLFWAFFVGFAIKVPMFPFHTWLPDAHVEAPTAGSVILAGVLLKMGTYGFLRFSLPICPDALYSDARFLGLTTVGWVAVLSIVGIVYGSMVAMVQKDMKKLVAYSSVAHLGFVMLGLFALNNAGIQGGILQSINHGLSTGGLFLLVGIVYERTHTRMIADYGGLSGVMPVYAMLFMVILLASIGLPLLNGFVGEFTILTGAFLADWRWAAWACLGVILGAAYMLWLYQRVFFGELTNEKNKDLEGREPARDPDARAPHRRLPLDRPLPEAVLRDDGEVGREDRGDGRRARPAALGVRAPDARGRDLDRRSRAGGCRGRAAAVGGSRPCRLPRPTRSSSCRSSS